MNSFLITVFLFTNSIHPDMGTTSLNFLKLGIGARPSGMGEACIAVVDDATSHFWNPACLINVQNSELHFMHTEHFEDIRFNVLSGVIRFGENGFGFGLVTLYTDLEYYEGASLEPLGRFGYQDMAVSFSYARRIDPEFSVGITFKELYEKIYLYDSFGFAIDGGALYIPAKLRGVRFAASFQNFGPKFGLEKVTYALPFVWKIGVGYPFEIPYGKIVADVDLVQPIDDYFRVNSGVEFDYKGTFQLRCGYKYGYYSETFSGGFGIVVRPIRLDYAFVPYSYDLGNTHRFSISFLF